MCQFCIEHGEGERWYLQAQNYSFDLQSDLKRRDYIVEFVDGFGPMRRNTIAWMERIGSLPAPLARSAKSAISSYMQPRHFGQPLTIEDAGRMLDLATSITVIPCVCRMHTPGKTADEVCLLVTTQPVEDLVQEAFSGYEDGPGLDDFHTLSRDEAMTLMRSCEEQGLMHSVWTFRTPFTAAICNCNLESGCMAMKLTAGYEMKLMWRGEDVAVFDTEACTGCAACVELCPFDAITATSGVAEHDPQACWGCGICRAACEADAISMVDRRTVPAVAALW